MNSIAALIASITGLLLVVGIFIVLYHPPKHLKKFKYKDMETEFDHSSQIAVEAISETSSTQAFEIDEFFNEELSNAIPDEPSDWKTLLMNGEYVRGIAELKQKLSLELDSNKLVNELAFWQHNSFIMGTIQAFNDLKENRKQNPENFKANYYLGMAYININEYQEAEIILNEAVSLCEKEDEKVLANIALSEVMIKNNKIKEAEKLLIELIRTIRNSNERSKLCNTLSSIYANNYKDLNKANFFRELALKYDPLNTSLQFDLAYNYGEGNINSLAFYHYSNLLKYQPNNDAANNNIGVAASNLNLAIFQIEHYKKAESLGSTLAASNMAFILIRNGFIKEAKDLLEKATQSSNPHRNVFQAMTNISSLQDEEEKKIDELKMRTKKLVDWKIKIAEALISENNYDGFAGTYKNPNETLILEKENNDNFTGKLIQNNGPSIEIIGKIDGKVLRFTWRLIPNPNESIISSAILQKQNGNGIFIIDSKELTGYTIEGEEKIDPFTVLELKEWRFTGNHNI